MVAKYGETIPEKILDRIRAEAELYEQMNVFKNLDFAGKRKRKQKTKRRNQSKKGIYFKNKKQTKKQKKQTKKRRRNTKQRI